MTRRLSTILSLAFVALLATLAAQEPTSITIRGGGPGSQAISPMQSWQTECNCLSVANCCSQDAAITPNSDPCKNPLYTIGCTKTTQEPIVITPGPTTITAPGLKVYTTFLGLPCGDAFPMPGCLPPAMQGWLVQIEGGADYQYLDVTLVYTDATGRRHTHTIECVPRAEPYQGKPPFTAIPFPVGRAKSPPWFQEGTTVIRTEVWPSRDGCEVQP